MEPDCYGHEFNADYTELTVRIRDDVEWSDGAPWTAHDVVFTVNMLKDHAPSLTYSTDMANWVEEAVAVDSLTARIKLTAPNPRFAFSYFTAIFGIGVPIVPRHIWEGKDPNTFENFDIARGWPVVSGPYAMTLSSPQQRSTCATIGGLSGPDGPSGPGRARYLPAAYGRGRARANLINAMDTSPTPPAQYPNRY